MKDGEMGEGCECKQLMGGEVWFCKEHKDIIHVLGLLRSQEATIRELVEVLKRAEKNIMACLKKYRGKTRHSFWTNKPVDPEAWSWEWNELSISYGEIEESIEKATKEGRG